jgi:WD40 repeat protein
VAGGDAGGREPSAFPLEVGWSASTALAAARDGRLLAVGGTNGMVAFHDGTTGAKLGVLEVGAAVEAMALDPSGQLLAVGGNDGDTRIYRLATRRLVAQVGGRIGTVRSVAATVDGSVATGDDAGAVRHWRGDAGRPVGEGDLVGMHEGRVRGLALTTGGRLLSAGADGLIRIWQVAASR